MEKYKFSLKFGNIISKKLHASICSILHYGAATKCHFTTTAEDNIKPDIHAANNRLAPFKKGLPSGPDFKDFFDHGASEVPLIEEPVVPYLQRGTSYGLGRKIYFEVYGCQMNVNDTEIIWSILKAHNYTKTEKLSNADIILIVTCAIREGAEARIWGRLNNIKGVKSKQGLPYKVGLLGCMAERLKHKVLEKEKIVDVVAGPDSYRDLPRLLALTENNQRSVNVLLSQDETYADITPVRLNVNSVTAFVSIMRGCDNMCTYCIVPYTRGRERSRPIDSILNEVETLAKQGVKEVTLLGQNVNSYRDLSQSVDTYDAINPTNLVPGFRTVYRNKVGGRRFADLLDKVADICPEMRIRFTSPHPKDFPDEVLDVIRSHSNICKHLHMPAQSGNSAVLERMRRGYTREAYLDLISHIRNVLPNVAFGSDFICGFCGETDEEFEDTITLMDMVKYNSAYLFAYSMREKTTAHRRYLDDVSPEVKQQRLQRMVDTYRSQVEKIHKTYVGKMELVLIEGFSKRSSEYYAGRNDHNIKVIIPKVVIPQQNTNVCRELMPGDYVAVKINEANSQVLKGTPLYVTSLSEFFEDSKKMSVNL